MKRLSLLLIVLAAGMTACTLTDSNRKEGPVPPMTIQSVEEAERVERSLENQPENLSARVGLARFYSSIVSSKPLLRSRKYDNIRWLVEHRPEYPELWRPEYSLDPAFDGMERYSRIGDLWRKAMEKHPKSAAVAFNAGKYFLMEDPQVAETCLKKACQLEPDSSIYACSLGHFYEIYAGRRSKIVLPDAWEKAMEEYERAYALNPARQAWLLPDIARLAWKLKQYSRLTSAIQQMEAALKNASGEWYAGNLAYWIPLSNGLLAVHDGDWKAAGEFLLKAAETPGSPQLNSFGPSMILADLLLKHGDREIVLAFLEKTRKFWSSRSQKADAWSKEIREGRNPDFGANLRY